MGAVGGDAAAQQRLLAYNEDDVRATLAIREWLSGVMSERVGTSAISRRTARHWGCFQKPEGSSSLIEQLGGLQAEEVGEVIGGLELLSGDHGSSGALNSLLQRDVVVGDSHGGFEEAFGAAGPHRGANLACDRRVGDDHRKSGQDVDQIGGADQFGGGERAPQLGVGERCFGEFGFGAVASGDVDRVFVDPCPR